MIFAIIEIDLAIAEMIFAIEALVWEPVKTWKHLITKAFS